MPANLPPDQVPDPKPAQAADRPGWVNMVAATLRLVDLHDTQRIPGGILVGQPDEARSGLSQGVLISIGWSMLEWLSDQEAEGNSDFVDIAPFMREMIETHCVTAADVQTVAMYMSTPTVLDFKVTDEMGAASGKSTGDTALIEKQRRGYGCRLKRTGRDALSLAGGYFKWVHAGIEARKLVSDLVAGDFASFRQQCLRLLARIGAENTEILQAMEQPEVEDLRAAFMRDSKRYSASMDEVIDVLREVTLQLGSKATVEAVEALGESDPDTPVTLGSLNDLRLRLSNAVAKLQRQFSRFMSVVQNRDRALVGVVRFDAIARSMLTLQGGPAVDPSFLARMMGSIGPAMADIQYFTPAELIGTVSIRKPRDKVAPVPRKVGHPVAATDRIERFISRNEAYLLPRLEAGDLTLGDLLTAEEIDHRDLDYILEASTLVISPQVIRFQGKADVKLSISVGPRMKWVTADGWEMSGTNLTLSIRGAPGRAATATMELAA